MRFTPTRRPTDLERVTLYAEKVGLAFQIIDDLLDVLGTPEQLGKTVGKDDQQHKATYPALHGLESRARWPAASSQEADETLEPFGRTRAAGCARLLNTSKQGIADDLSIPVPH